MVAAPPQMGHRTDGYDDDRRRPEHELHRRDDLGGERRDGEVREERKLTLVKLVQVVRPEKTRTMASIPSSRLRLLPAGGRRR